jgi:hypothetical protein
MKTMLSTAGDLGNLAGVTAAAPGTRSMLFAAAPYREVPLFNRP